VRRQELQALQQGAEKQRRKALRTAPVVASTCCTLLREALWDNAGTRTALVGMPVCV